MKNILVIKLGALGDFVQATGAFSSIKRQHPNAEITLLTTKGMMPFAKENPFFDNISIDERKKPYNFTYLKDIKNKLSGFDMVYDLQTNDRTNYLYYFLAGRPKWCGIAPGCSHKQTHPNRPNMHTLDRLEDLLQVAGIEKMDKPDLRYAAKDCSEVVKSFELNLSKLVLLVPGGSAHRPEKRWSYFSDLSNKLEAKGYQVALVGAGAEVSLLENISKECNAVNLCNQTSIGQLIDISSKVVAVIGNDTGPTHMAAASGAKGAVLFGSASDPKRCAPRAKGMHIFHEAEIDAITTQEIIEKLKL